MQVKLTNSYKDTNHQIDKEIENLNRLITNKEIESVKNKTNRRKKKTTTEKPKQKNPKTQTS